MLELKQIHKYYYLESQTVKALKGIDIKFRKNEFVSVLGPSGCGKTTLLNLIGGLDKYTSGDLIINGKSTKDFKDKDWDSYRNHSIGFVFQNYNLIPHLTVLENVELALALSGVSKSERKKRAEEVLQKVGLGDKLKSKPNQLSGGQMQRVAIARALINNPDILLADEPTGALDTKTSEQVMDILKEISKERLIIMVTHNSEIANKYSSRIIKLLDGELTDDSNPYEGSAAPISSPEKFEKKVKVKRDKSLKTSMSFLTALSLSFKNLLTKKTRTFLVSLAGSIGIIGIALILALSSGFQGYINKVQNDTLSTYPLSIERENIDLEGLLTIIKERGNSDDIEREADKIYSNDIMIKMFETVMSQIHSNNLKDFKKHIDENREELDQYLTDIKYGYDVDLQIYTIKDNDSVFHINPTTVFQQTLPKEVMSPFMGMNFNVWTQMIDNQKVLESQYDLLAGSWPDRYDEVVVVVDKNNQINDFTLYALGIKDQTELAEILMKIMQGEELDYPPTVLEYEDILNLDYKLILPTDYYQLDTDEDSETYGQYTEVSNEDLKNKINSGLKLKVTGIIRPNEEAAATSISGTVGYTAALTEYYINAINATDIAIEQTENQEIDVFSGKTFDELQIEEIDQYILDDDKIPDTETQLDDDTKHEKYAKYIDFKSTYQNNLKTLGITDLNDPDYINFYATDFKSKDKLKEFIAEYNATQEDENIISYTDYVDIMMSSITVIINAITYVLIGFVTISLVVSSIMIGIITYISVLERIKEIGLLRSIGASKKDISRVFNAETLIIGLVAGLLGILITVLLTIPINIILTSLAEIPAIAVLPFIPAIVLILISMGLTLIAGFIPSKIAAKKNPVEALRTE